MKFLIFLCVFAVAMFALADAKPPVGGYKECEPGTHLYATGCSYLMPEATCENPNPVKDTRGMLCDYVACYCDAPTVRDTASGKCVKLEDCPEDC